MFKKIIQQIFKTTKNDQPGNYSYFEEGHRKVLASTKAQALTASDSIELYLSQEEQYQYEFYDFLFGKNTQVADNDELSIHISQQIELLLNKPGEMLKSLPVLPASLAKIIESISNRDFDTDDIVKLIAQEPVIAAKVIALANSPYYNRTSKEIIDIKKAFMVLGVSGLSEGVINGFISTLMPQSSFYFQHYGEKIWQHSLSTSLIAKDLISSSPHSHNAAQGYLVGLTCNLGGIIIYQLMLEAFAIVHPDHQPNSVLFKKMIRDNANKLTYFMAKHWGLPLPIINILALQREIKRSAQLEALFEKQPVACYIYEARIISKLELMIQSEYTFQADIAEISASLLYSKEAKNYLKRFESQVSVPEEICGSLA